MNRDVPRGPDRPEPLPARGPSFPEFVALMAAVMALNALAIDTMLPGLAEIADALGATAANDRQLIVSAYLIGFGLTQIVYGPLSDRYGRRPVLISSLIAYVATSLVAALATDFALLLAARFAQGAAAGAFRVLPISMIRDRYSGERMARVTSLCFIVFLIVPVIAPSLGQLILLVAPWRAIFITFAGAGAIMCLWSLLRLPETLPSDRRLSLDPRALARSARIVLADRRSVGYTLGAAALLGSLFGFINSVQQLYGDVFHQPDFFPIIFGATAGTMAVASLVNAYVVERLGLARVSHAAAIGFTLLSGLNLALGLAGRHTILSFSVLQALAMGCVALTLGNFSAIAMQRLGHVAGMASSLQGFVVSTAGAFIGLLIGQSFDGTTVPVTAGFLVCGISALLLAAITERGKLFAPRDGLAAPGSAS